MIIPARRLMWLAAVPLVVILGGRGAPGAIVAAWILMGSLLAAFVVDGLMAGRRSRLRLHRETPSQLHVDQPDRIAWIVENQSRVHAGAQLSDRVPDGARANPPTLEVNAPPRSRTTFHYELVPTGRGMAAFGDLDYRIRGPLGPGLVAKAATGAPGDSLPAAPGQCQGGRTGGAACVIAAGGQPSLSLARRRHVVRVAPRIQSRRMTFAGSTGRPPRG